MRHVRRFSFQYYDFVRQCHAFDLAWRHFDHLPLLKFAHFAHFPNLSLDTPASLESSSSVWIGSAFSEICKSWGLIPPVDVACFSFAFAWITFFIFKANSERWKPLASFLQDLHQIQKPARPIIPLGDQFPIGIFRNLHKAVFVVK